MGRFVKGLLVICLTVALSAPASAVDFQEELKKLAENNARGYINPFATAFGTAMNSGLYHTARPHGILGFDISVKVTAALVSDEDKFYDFFVPGEIGIPLNILQPGSTDTLKLNGFAVWPDRRTSTVFGPDSSRSLRASGAEGELERTLKEKGWTDEQITAIKGTVQWQGVLDRIPSITTVRGLNLDGLPMVMPQVSVGLPFKTEVLARYIPEIDAGDIGKVKFLGLGLKHNVSQYIPVPMFPVDISLQYVWQKLEVGDILESNHTALNIQASKKLGLPLLSITPYVGVGFESSDLKVDYTIENSGSDALNGQTVSFDLEGDNKTRITGGIRLGLTFLTINADYSLGAYSAYSVGVGLTIR